MISPYTNVLCRYKKKVSFEVGRKEIIKKKTATLNNLYFAVGGTAIPVERHSLQLLLRKKRRRKIQKKNGEREYHKEANDLCPLVEWVPFIRPDLLSFTRKFSSCHLHWTKRRATMTSPTRSFKKIRRWSNKAIFYCQAGFCQNDDEQ